MMLSSPNGSFNGYLPEQSMESLSILMMRSESSVSSSFSSGDGHLPQQVLRQSSSCGTQLSQISASMNPHFQQYQHPSTTQPHNGHNQHKQKSSHNSNSQQNQHVQYNPNQYNQHAQWDVSASTQSTDADAGASGSASAQACVRQLHSSLLPACHQFGFVMHRPGPPAGGQHSHTYFACQSQNERNRWLSSYVSFALLHSL